VRRATHRGVVEAGEHPVAIEDAPVDHGQEHVVLVGAVDERGVWVRDRLEARARDVDGDEVGRLARLEGADIVAPEDPRPAPGRPGDALVSPAAAGGAAYIVGPWENALAELEGSYSYVTDTPDFWRREGQKYPSHGQRFTGEPAYFHHIISATQTLMDALGATAADFTYAVFHQPNAKFPRTVAKRLGFSEEQIAPGLLSPVIGNTYAGASLIGLSAVLDIAKPGDRILVTSFGSGAGSDAFAVRVTDAIEARRSLAPTTADYIARRTEIDYARYARLRGKLTL
jgi:hydroxymethylglutaryl-CoA synthase